MRLNVQAFRQRQKDKSCTGTTSGPGEEFTIIIEDPSRKQARNKRTTLAMLSCDMSETSLVNRSRQFSKTPEEDKRPSEKPLLLQALDPCQKDNGVFYDVQSGSYNVEPRKRPLGVISEIDQRVVYSCAPYGTMHERYNAAARRRPLGMLSEIDQSQVYKGAYYNALYERYKPDPQLRPDDSMVLGGYRQGEIPYSCLSWLVAAIDGARYDASDVLADAMLSMALGVVGSQQNDMRLLTTAQRTYQTALVKINRGFSTLKLSDKPRDLTSGYLPLACFACAWVELMANRCIESFEKHLNGIASLIASCDVEILENPVLHALSWEHRGLYIMFSFLNRRLDFYSEPKWIAYFDTRREEHRYRYFETLTSIACRIPGLLEQYDTGFDTSDQELGRLIRSALEVDRLLDDWRVDFENAIPVPLTTEIPRLTSDPFPARIAHASFGIALSLLYYSAFKIYNYLLLLDAASDLSHPAPCLTSKATQRALTCARSILASMSYCQDSSSGLLDKCIALFPFDSAWQVFLKLHSIAAGRDYSRQLAFCTVTAQRLQQLGLTLLRDRIEEQECCLRQSPTDEDTMSPLLSHTGRSMSSESTAVEPAGQLRSATEDRDSTESRDTWHNVFDEDVGSIEHILSDDSASRRRKVCSDYFGGDFLDSEFCRG